MGLLSQLLVPSDLFPSEQGPKQSCGCPGWSSHQSLVIGLREPPNSAITYTAKVHEPMVVIKAAKQLKNAGFLLGEVIQNSFLQTGKAEAWMRNEA